MHRGQGIENKRTRELSEEELTSLRDEVEKYTIEGDLRRFNALNIKRLKEIQCYRGRRHIAVRCCLTFGMEWHQGSHADRKQICQY